MKENHTLEPVKISDKGFEYLHGIGNACRIHAKDGGWLIAIVMQKEGVDNARRIVACWNACEGIETETLESGNIGDFGTAAFNMASENNKLRLQNAELLNALKRIRDGFDGYNPADWKAIVEENREVSAAAIASIEQPTT